mmetsp:Transcript_16130/g.18280  ORF Transcript_16130/g.18280 Transcript_16130/m.18280 type:complete len:202 (-) Transcript_16130:159-764(-)|eukprot:CAMPEP_0184021482 /NCGR_PEP_ID=MMETSP0954-20121128/9958_1 /TAXON_ID=627963 /ORGANISM="Aplanochytrium sp, Strain PBS07" /LENGTH=201 /DNA_ID=CAMNT_0026303517 /DNA_START=271 /DNA_END=876 /DNA_ORIENTATION=-
MALAPEELSRILPIVPILISVLRKGEKRAADLLLSVGDVSDVQDAISTLHEDVNIEQRQFTITQLRFKMYDHENSVWAEAIKTVLTGCAPRLILDEVAAKLLSVYSKNSSELKSNDKVCGAKLGSVLDDLPRTRFQVLAELCAFIRDTSSSSDKLAEVFAKELLAPNGSSNDAVAVELFKLMIEKAEPLFGRPAAVRTAGR